MKLAPAHTAEAVEPAAKVRQVNGERAGLGKLAESVRWVYARTSFAERHTGQIARLPKGLHASLGHEQVLKRAIVTGQGPKGQADILFRVRAGSAATNPTEQ